MSVKGSLIDIILTNKPRSFHKTQVFFTGISGFHNLLVTMLRCCYKKLPAKNILYRNVKRFEKTTFLQDLDSRLIQGELYNNCQEPYNKPTQIFCAVLDYRTHVKQKIARGNQSPFMTKDLSKAVMLKSRAKNQYVKCPSKKNISGFQKSYKDVPQKKIKKAI